MYLGLVNNFKNSQKEKAKNKVKKTAKRTIMSAFIMLSKLIIIPLVIVLIGSTFLDWVVEIFTARDTPEKIYDYFKSFLDDLIYTLVFWLIAFVITIFAF